MNKLVVLSVLALATMATGARLDNSYLPPRGSSGTGGGFISAPGEGQDDFGYAARSNGLVFNSISGSYNRASSGYRGSSFQAVPTLSYSNIPNNGDGSYSYRFEGSNGIRVQESGRAGPASQVTGGYSYVGEDGRTYSITYTADERGFRAQGAHLPTPPPIPKEILASLALQGITVNPDGSYSGGNPNDDGSYDPTYDNFNSYRSSSPSRGSQGGFRSGTFSPSSGYNY